MNLHSRMKQDLEATKRDLVAGIERTDAPRRRRLRRPMIVAGVGAVALSGAAVATGSATGVIDLPGGEADWPDSLICPGIGGPNTQAFVDPDAGADTADCRQPTAAEREELEALNGPSGGDDRFHYVIEVPPIKDEPGATVEWHSDEPLKLRQTADGVEADPGATGDGEVFLLPPGRH